jgi:hypothetical protein
VTSILTVQLSVLGGLFNLSGCSSEAEGAAQALRVPPHNAYGCGASPLTAAAQNPQCVLKAETVESERRGLGCGGQVISESRAQLVKAQKLLAQIKEAYPEVLRGIKTTQLAQELLLYKEELLKEIGETGTAPPLHWPELRSGCLFLGRIFGKHVLIVILPLERRFCPGRGVTCCGVCVVLFCTPVATLKGLEGFWEKYFERHCSMFLAEGACPGVRQGGLVGEGCASDVLQGEKSVGTECRPRTTLEIY